MKTLVINLKRSTDRRERMTRILHAFPSLDVEFTDAVDGREMTREELAQRFDRGGGIFGTWVSSVPER